MRRAALALTLLCVAACASGCFLDGIFVRERYIRDSRPYIATYKIPDNQTYKEFWGAKRDYFQALQAWAADLTPREQELLEHLFDYKNVFEQLDEAVREYNNQALDHNKRYGYEP
jgi:hypothetical protein